MSGIPNYIPTMSGNEKKYLKECVDTGWISSVGPFVDKLEMNFAKYHKGSSAAAVSSGTSALHLGLVALGVKLGDYVIVPTLTFIGSINPIRYCGADPILIDADRQSLNMNLSVLEEFLSKQTMLTKKGLVLKKDRRRISAIMAVHLYGQPEEMNKIMHLARKYNLAVIEDAAESLGATYKGKLVGTIGDVGCFSFNGNKIVTTGGGGIIISRNKKRLEFCKHLSKQAKIKDSFSFDHDEIGFNYRLSNICAAVGVAQFESIDRYISIKRKQFQFYKSLFRGLDNWELVEEARGNKSTYWMIVARRINRTKDIYRKVRQLVNKGIGIRAIWKPIHTMSLYKKAHFVGGNTAEKTYKTSFCLPSSVSLKNEDIKRVVNSLSKV